MNTQTPKTRPSGYTLTEVATVLLVLSLLVPLGIKGFSLYRDRAEFMTERRASQLDELIAMDRRTPAAAEPAPALEEDTPEGRASWLARWKEWRRTHKGRGWHGDEKEN